MKKQRSLWVLLVMFFGCSGGEPAESMGSVVAVVNGDTITEADVTGAVSDRFPTGPDALEFLIGETLLLQEAERIGVREDSQAGRRAMVQALLDQLAVDHSPSAITPAEVEAEYMEATARLEENGGGVLPSMEVVESPIREGLAGRRRLQAANDLVEPPRLEPERTRALLDLPVFGSEASVL